MCVYSQSVSQSVFNSQLKEKKKNNNGRIIADSKNYGGEFSLTKFSFNFIYIFFFHFHLFDFMCCVVYAKISQ